MDVQLIQSRLKKFAEERDWEQFHNPKNITMALSVEVAELVEIFQWSNSGGLDEINDPDIKAQIEKEIADIFADGPEFFSTFGGSTLSCMIGNEVLEIVDDEGLQENAKQMGDRLLTGLRGIKNNFPQIGDVRGMGLFLGIDLVKNNTIQDEDKDLCTYIKNRMRDYRILIGSEGPKDNVLKIRPPLTIDSEGVDMILHFFEKIMKEV